MGASSSATCCWSCATSALAIAFARVAEAVGELDETVIEIKLVPRTVSARTLPASEAGSQPTPGGRFDASGLLHAACSTSRLVAISR